MLERRFNVQIVIEDPELSSEVFTCHSEDSAGIDQILKLLQQTRMLKYQRNKNQIIISKYSMKKNRRCWRIFGHQLVHK